MAFAGTVAGAKSAGRAFTDFNGGAGGCRSVAGGGGAAGMNFKSAGPF